MHFILFMTNDKHMQLPPTTTPPSFIPAYGPAAGAETTMCCFEEYKLNGFPPAIWVEGLFSVRFNPQ